MKNNRGFTLIELLLYISIASTIVFTTASMLRFTLESRVKNQTIAEVQQQGSQVMQLITQTIRTAKAINSPTLGNSASSLSLEVEDEASNPTVFDLSTLTSSKVTVSNLNFQNLSRAGTPNIIRVSFTITYINSSGRNEYSFTQNFYGSADLRK